MKLAVEKSAIYLIAMDEHEVARLLNFLQNAIELKVTSRDDHEVVTGLFRLLKEVEE